MMLTPGQIAKFWRLWARAEAEVLPASATRAERDAIRHSTILGATGKTSLKLVGRTDEFERLMLATAQMAGDYQEASYWCVGEERRLAHMVAECARQIGEIAGVPHGWEYCRATLHQAGLPESWQDLPSSLLGATFAMIDTHRRRLLTRDWHWAGSADGQPLGFDPSIRYECLLGGLRITHLDHHHASVA
jgi:hypothetical protein